MARPTFSSDPRVRRNVSMGQSVWKGLAERARANGFRGGVSELLERLAIAELNRKRGIAHLNPRPLPAPEREGA